jgi:hypothetical protein
MDFKYKDYGDTTLFFSPNAKMLELIVPYLPREIKREFQKTYKGTGNADDE